MDWHKKEILKYEKFHFLEINSDIKILYPNFAYLILKLFANAYSSGLKVLIKETYRSQARQFKLFQEGHTQLKQNGMHHFGVATDFCFRDTQNKPPQEKDWQILGEIGRNLGLFWGGDWKTFKDFPHFQLIPATIEDQKKIMNGQYPRLGKTCLNLQKILLFYEAAKKDNYSVKSMGNLISIAKKLHSPVDKKLCV